MIHKISALLAAAMIAFVTLAPAPADARDGRGRGYYERDHGRYYGDRGRRWRDHDDDGDAVAAGVVGLVLGLAIGSMVSQPREPRYACRDNYQRCAPPPQQGYYDQGGYYDRRSAYEQDYGYAPPPPPRGYYEAPQCTRRERQWDRYANQYVVVDVPC